MILLIKNCTAPVRDFERIYKIERIMTKSKSSEKVDITTHSILLSMVCMERKKVSKLFSLIHDDRLMSVVS